MEKDKFLQLTWQRYILPPIHPEGLKIMGIIFGLFVLLGVFFPAIWWVGLPVTVLGLLFFRNPVRVPPKDETAVLAPADGIVCALRTMTPPETLGLPKGKYQRVSIFMSVFNVHVNRSPVTGIVEKQTYHAGKFVNVAHKDSEFNERKEMCLKRPDGLKVGVVQIAGLVARRIYSPLKNGQQLTAGDVFGLIRFGSRLDVYLPLGTKWDVELGQTMIAGETILARIPMKK